MTTAHSLALLFALVAGVEFEPGSQWTFQGSLVAEKEEIAASKKDFQLTLWIAETEPATRATCLWTLEEKGRGGWSWPDRFGRFTIGRDGKVEDGAIPALLYQREEGLSVVPLTPPVWIASEPLKKDDAWRQGDWQFAVEGEVKAADCDCWSVVVANAYGPRRTLLIDKASPALAAVNERVTIGQGHQHELQYELTNATRLSAEEFAAVQRGLDGLSQLREKLGHKPRTATTAWQDEQLDTLKAELPKLAVPKTSAPLIRLVMAAEEDLKTQKNRAGAVEALEKQTLGAKLPEFNLLDLQGKKLDAAELKDKVTVLHFWEYRDTPLQEPYGQIGYLDFLDRQQTDDGVQIIGVNVDPRLAEAAERGRAVASARKLVAFMRVGFPVVSDDGKLIESIGDPRVIGAKLPLFVVVDRKGTVVHYHVGAYKVDRDRGLLELDEVIEKALASGG